MSAFYSSVNTESLPLAIKVGMVISLLLVVVFLIRRRKPKPSRLKLEPYRDPKGKLPGLRKVQAEVVDE